MAFFTLTTACALQLILAFQVDAATLRLPITKFRYVAVCSVGYSVEIARYETVRDETSCSSLCASNTACRSFVYLKNESYCSLKNSRITDMTLAECLQCPMQVYGEPTTEFLPRSTRKLRCGGGGCTTSSNNFRLCDGGGPGVCDVMQGRLEVYYNGQWGSVCDDGFSTPEATVTCKMFGYSDGIRHCCAHFGEAPSSYPILLDDVKCSGSEICLDECPHRPFGSHDCGHQEDVAVVCE